MLILTHGQKRRERVPPSEYPFPQSVLCERDRLTRSTAPRAPSGPSGDPVLFGSLLNGLLKTEFTESSSTAKLDAVAKTEKLAELVPTHARPETFLSAYDFPTFLGVRVTAEA